jgi:hypothetical protein
MASPEDFRLSIPESGPAQGHDPKTIMRVRSSSNPAAGRGKMPETDERMDAIRNSKTMAGLPDAGLRPASSHLAMVFFVLGRAPFFRKHMKEDPYVQ